MIADYVSYEMIAITMFATMLLMLLTGQRVFGAIGFVAAIAALLLWGDGAIEMPYTAAWKLFKWYPMLTLPLFIYMGYMISESGIADDLYKMFHVYCLKVFITILMHSSISCLLTISGGKILITLSLALTVINLLL